MADDLKNLVCKGYSILFKCHSVSFLRHTWTKSIYLGNVLQSTCHLHQLVMIQTWHIISPLGGDNVLIIPYIYPRVFAIWIYTRYNQDIVTPQFYVASSGHNKFWNLTGSSSAVLSKDIKAYLLCSPLKIMIFRGIWRDAVLPLRALGPCKEHHRHVSHSNIIPLIGHLTVLCHGLKKQQ